MMKIILFILTLTLSVSAQRIEITNVDASNYPDILVEVDAFEANEEQYRGIADNPLKIFENGVERTVTDKFCEEDAVRFSLLIAVDISGSVELNLNGDAYVNAPNRRYDAIKDAIKVLIQNLDLSASEVALFTILGQSTLELEFSQEQSEIIQAVNSFPPPGSRADINSAFLGVNMHNNPGGIGTLPYAEEFARWKPVVIYLSDGSQLGDPPNTQPPILSEIREDEIKQKAQEIGAIVYNINFGDYDNADLEEISSATGGKVYDKSQVSDVPGIQNVLADIIKEVTENPAAKAPCEINFTSDCDGGGELVVETTIDGTPVSATTTYQIPDNVKPDLLIDIADPTFLNVADGTQQDITIELTAKDNDITITDFNSDDGRFIVRDINGSLTIPKGESRDVRVRFIADSEKTCLEPTITFVSNACSGNTILPKAGWLEAMNVNVGSAQLGSDVTNNRTFFTNNTCEPITIDRIVIDRAEFRYDGADLPMIIQPGGTASIDFTYEPTVTGNFSSPFTVELDNGDEYDATISAGGTGNAIIANTNPNTATVKCDAEGEIRFNIENSGEIDLEVSNVTIDNPDFTLVSSTSFDVTSNDTEEVVIRFSSASEGTQNAIVTFTSNAENEPSFQVNITGVRSNISARTIESEVDLGVICPNTDYTFSFILDNNGEVGTDLTLQTSSSEITFTNGTGVSLPNVGSQEEVEIVINSGSEGAFDEDIVIIDECGAQQTVIPVRGTVRTATVDYEDIATININSNLNEPVTEIISIKNQDSRDLENIVFSTTSQYFTIVPGANTQTSVAGDGTMTVEVEYLPTMQGTHDLDILVTGEVDGNACLSTQLATIQGNTNIAQAEFSVGTYEGLIEEVIELDAVDLVDVNGFATSGVSEIEIDVVVNQRLLTTADGLINNVVGDDRTIEYTFDVNSPQPLRLLVLDPNDPTINSCEIQYNVKSTVPAGRASITSNAGQFNLIRAGGKIEVPDLEAKTGDKVTITITGNDLVEVDPQHHKSIKGELKYNASILVPTGNTPLGRYEKPYRFIPFTMELIPPSPKYPSIQTADAIPVNLEFTATLGDAETTDLELVNLESEVGVIELENPNLGEFRLTDVCKDDEGNILLLWVPYEDAPITFSGANPISSTTQFELNALEDGPYKIYITDFNGNKSDVIFEGDLKHGSHQFTINPEKYSQGVYYINVVAPSERFVKSFIYQK